MTPEDTPRSWRNLPEMENKDITVPGCYLVTSIGRLMRITKETLPWYQFNDFYPRFWVARLSDDPDESIARLRQIANQQGFFVNF
jgi:hypothetical protein